MFRTQPLNANNPRSCELWRQRGWMVWLHMRKLPCSCLKHPLIHSHGDGCLAFIFRQRTKGAPAVYMEDPRFNLWQNVWEGQGRKPLQIITCSWKRQLSSWLVQFCIPPSTEHLQRNCWDLHYYKVEYYFHFYTTPFLYCQGPQGSLQKFLKTWNMT